MKTESSLYEQGLVYFKKVRTNRRNAVSWRRLRLNQAMPLHGTSLVYSTFTSATFNKRQSVSKPPSAMIRNWQQLTATSAISILRKATLKALQRHTAGQLTPIPSVQQPITIWVFYISRWEI